MRRHLKKIALSLAALLIVSEGALRLLAPRPQFAKTELDLYNTIPNIDGEGTLFKEKVHLSLDHLMARPGDYTHAAKPSGTVRVLCLGGSSTLNMLQADADTWWGQLQQKLKAAGHRTEFAAYGANATNTILRSSNQLKEVVLHYQPDVIITSYGFEEIIAAPLDYTYQPNREPALAAIKKDTGIKAIITSTQLGRAWRQWRQNARNGILQDEKGRKNHILSLYEAARAASQNIPTTTPPLRDTTNDPIKEFSDGLANLKELARQVKAVLILTGEPCLHDRDLFAAQEALLISRLALQSDPKSKIIRPAPAWVAAELERYATEAAAFASKNQIPWIDLNGRVPKLASHFFTDTLLTDTGAECAAEHLLPLVEPIIKARATSP